MNTAEGHLYVTMHLVNQAYISTIQVFNPADQEKIKIDNTEVLRHWCMEKRARMEK